MQLALVPETVSMHDLKNNTRIVTEKFAAGPVLLLNRATPQGVIVSPAQWNTIVQRIANLEDTVATLQAELELAAGDDTIETVVDTDAFLNEVMGNESSVSA